MGATAEWLVAHMDSPPDTDDCVEWPFARTGSGHAVCHGVGVGRVLLGLQRGDGLVARHTCHNAGCVNRRHLIPGTPADNSRDMVESGRSLRGEKNPNYGKRSRPGRRPYEIALRPIP